jgi:hypothetical protein
MYIYKKRHCKYPFRTATESVMMLVGSPKDFNMNNPDLRLARCYSYLLFQ